MISSEEAAQILDPSPEDESTVDDVRLVRLLRTLSERTPINLPSRIPSLHLPSGTQASSQAQTHTSPPDASAPGAIPIPRASVDGESPPHSSSTLQVPHSASPGRFSPNKTISSSPSFQKSSNDLYLKIDVEDFVELHAARKSAGLFAPDLTVKEVLARIAKKGGILLEETDVEFFGLFVAHKKKPLPLDKTLKSLGIKSNETLILRRAKKELINLVIYMEDHPVHSSSSSLSSSSHSYMHLFHVMDTVGDVISKLVANTSLQLNVDDQDSYALFLPTIKSKTGLFMERDKTLKSFRLPDKTTVVFKHRKKEEVILNIQIHDFRELQTAKKITTMLNINSCISEVLVKISRKGNVNIPDITNYKLTNHHGVTLKSQHTLKDYAVQNRDTLFLSRKNLFKSLFRKAKEDNAIILCERNPATPFVSFPSVEHAKLYWSMSDLEEEEGAVAQQQAAEGGQSSSDDTLPHPADRTDTSSSNHGSSEPEGADIGPQGDISSLDTYASVPSVLTNTPASTPGLTPTPSEEEDSQLFPAVSRPHRSNALWRLSQQQEQLLSEALLNFQSGQKVTKRPSSENLHTPTSPPTSPPTPRHAPPLSSPGISSSSLFGSNKSYTSAANGSPNTSRDTYESTPPNRIGSPSNSQKYKHSPESSQKFTHSPPTSPTTSSRNYEKHPGSPTSSQKYRSPNTSQKYKMHGTNHPGSPTSSGKYRSPNTSQKFNKQLDKELKNKLSSPQKGKGNRPGRIPKKKTENTALTLVQIYHSDSRFWTLAVNQSCTAKDVCRSIVDMLKSNAKSSSTSSASSSPSSSSSSAPVSTASSSTSSVSNLAFLPLSLYETEKKDTELVFLKKLNDTDVICEVKERWQLQSSITLRFYIKQDRERAPSLSDTPCPDDNNNFSSDWDKKVIPGTLRNATDLVDLLQKKRGSLDELPSSTPANKSPLRNSLLTKRRGNSAPTAIIINKNKSAEEGKEKEAKWIEVTEIKKERKLSKGAFAKVYLGSYTDKTVAIKTLMGSVTEQQIASFQTEFEILSSVKSEFLVNFFGAVVEPNDRLSFVMEFCPNGSLHDLMNLKSDQVTFTWELVLKWAIQTVKGVDVLHTYDPPLVHRDIKSLNLLLDADFNIKVCDFGLSRFRILNNAQTLAELRGTMAYCPPEIYEGQLFSPKSDIYSIGIVLWEMVARIMKGEYCRPFAEFNEISFDFQIIVQTSRNGLRPTLPETCPRIFKQLIEECWHQDPDKRPSCLGILHHLQVMAEEVIKHPSSEQANVLHRL